MPADFRPFELITLFVNLFDLIAVSDLAPLHGLLAVSLQKVFFYVARIIRVLSLSVSTFLLNFVHSAEKRVELHFVILAVSDSLHFLDQILDPLGTRYPFFFNYLLYSSVPIKLIGYFPFLLLEVLVLLDFCLDLAGVAAFKSEVVNGRVGNFHQGVFLRVVAVRVTKLSHVFPLKSIGLVCWLFIFSVVREVDPKI